MIFFVVSQTNLPIDVQQPEKFKLQATPMLTSIPNQRFTGNGMTPHREQRTIEAASWHSGNRARDHKLGTALAVPQNKCNGVRNDKQMQRNSQKKSQHMPSHHSARSHEGKSWKHTECRARAIQTLKVVCNIRSSRLSQWFILSGWSTTRWWRAAHGRTNSPQHQPQTP